MKQQLLLLEDIDGLGRSGDVVSARPGYVRNFLLPQKLAVILDKRTIRMRERLQQERQKQAEEDRVEAEKLAETLKGFILPIEVKVDPEGHMYGSVSVLDIARLLKQKGYDIERKNIVLPAPLKKIGKHEVQLKLKEAVPALISVEISAESTESLQGA